MRILGLDIGKKRTGVAFVDDTIGVPLALDTLIADDEADLVGQLLQLCDEREADLLVIGLPLLLSGEEGTQSSFVRLIGSRLEEAEVPVEYLDERYTTQKHGETDGDARAACQILQLFLDRRAPEEVQD
jgi:putative holliday junction resolvase